MEHSRHTNPSSPSVSVVIPAYNEEKFIRNTLESLLKQSQKDFELIVVDNNSTDKTAEIAREYGATVIREHTAGVGSARQRGGMEAKGTIIATTDADTRVPPDWVERIEKAYQNNPLLVAYGGMFQLYSGPGSAKFFIKHLMYYFYKFSGLFAGGDLLFGMNMSMRKNAFEKVGGYNTKLVQGEDTDLTQKLHKVGKVVLDKNFVVLSSGRRYKDGVIGAVLSYGLNFPIKILFGKDTFQRFPTIREEAK